MKTEEERFGQLVKATRKALGWPQRRLAAELISDHGIVLDNSAITRIENGQRSVKFGEALALADTLGIDLSTFFSTDTAQNALMKSTVAQIKKFLLDTHRHLDELAGL